MPEPEIRHPREVTTIATLACNGGTCPTIYRAVDGTYLVQGPSVDPAAFGIVVPAEESLVAVPEALVAQLLEVGRQAG
ncbi:hypothetical protein GCM10009687_71450 [Asanoa iriomotensis]|uniref:Uncharacterized protein n=1 Tax=Asanoa iriomotensis TaxID=234613 RepID=A0ABQ4C126_9ACTN|nr:hypothetical protein Air01nite_25640 [Asanoa iriomotensis]